MMANGVIEFKPRTVKMVGELVPLAQQYLKSLVTASKSPETVKAYTSDLRFFVGYLQQVDVGLIQIISHQNILGFIDAMREGEGNSDRTIGRKIEAVRGFFKYAQLRNLIAETVNPMRFIDPIKGRISHAVAPDEDKILEVIHSIPADGVLNIRDRALFRLMYVTAMRISEPLSIQLYQAENPAPCTLHNNNVVSYLGKGNQVRSAGFDDETRAMLDAYLLVRFKLTGLRDDGALFIGRGGRVMGRGAVHARFKLHAKRIPGMAHLHAHQFRHRRAKQVLDVLGLDAASSLLGHKDRATTANMYGFECEEKNRQLIRALVPVPVPQQGEVG